MEIIKITPRGYCKGVVKAIEIAKNTRKQYPSEKITILGMLVHNKHVVEALDALNIITIDDKKKTRSELLDEVEDGIVIFTAHGVSQKVIDKAISKGLTVIDASCQYVTLIHDLVKEKLNEGFEIGYIGKKNHPESEAVLELDERVHLVENENDLTFNHDKLFFTNQTTLSYFDIKELYQKIQEKYPHAIINNEICNATQSRQEAVMNTKDLDALIVVGDPHSHNTSKLASIGKKNTQHVFCIENAYDLLNIDLTKFNRIGITSGASTPTKITNQVIHYLETNEIIDLDPQNII